MPPRADPPEKAVRLAGRRIRLPRLPLVRRFLGLDLFWKIVVANTALVLGTAALVFASLSPGSGGLTLLGVAALTAGVSANAALVHAALSPLYRLRRTAAAVGAGDLGARVGTSALADREMELTLAVFDGMLDTLEENRIRQRELARRVLESEERERERIAHELFAGTAQTLAGVLVRLRIAERSFSNGASKAFAELREGIVEALEEVRALARRLRPPELDELGVRAALEAHARAASAGHRVDVQIAGDVPELPPEVALALFRIVQEAVANAIHHGDPNELTVTFRTDADDVEAEIVDDGCGFEPDVALARTSDSLGLFGMHERAGYVRGELSLESGPGRGTRVKVRIPLGGPDHPPRWEATAERLVHGLMEAHGPAA